MTGTEFEIQPKESSLDKAIARHNGKPSFSSILSSFSHRELVGFHEYMALQLGPDNHTNREIPTDDASDLEPAVTTKRRYILKPGSRTPTILPHKHNAGEEWIAELRRRFRIPPTYLLRAPEITLNDYISDKPKEKKSGHKAEMEEHHGLSDPIQNAIDLTFAAWDLYRPED